MHCCATLRINKVEINTGGATKLVPAENQERVNPAAPPAVAVITIT